MTNASDTTSGSMARDTYQGSSAVVLIRVLLYGGLVAALAAVGYNWIGSLDEQAARRNSDDKLVAFHGLSIATPQTLASGYADTDGDLVADQLAADSPQALDPDTLVLAYYYGDDPEDRRIDWEGLRVKISEVTGKEVEATPYLNSAREVAAVKDGKIHLVVVHAADTPYLVNNAGFVPVGVLGSRAEPSGNHLAIAVRKDSKIKKLNDIRGKTLTCTRPDSITGYRSAVAVLSREAGMRPGVDYEVQFSLGQSISVLGLAEGEFEVTALSNDKLQSMIAKGEIEKDAFRLIYESQIVPRRTIGYIHCLQPDLANKVAEAIFAFDNAEGEIDEETGKPMHFFQIDYEKDFEFPRYIDDCFDPRFRINRDATVAPGTITEEEAEASTADETETEEPAAEAAQSEDSESAA